MALIQNEDNKCPTTKQVNDALESIGGVQTLVLTTQDLTSTSRSSPLEINSSDQAVMDTVKSNMMNNIPFQLLYYGTPNGGGSTQSLPVSLLGAPSSNMFVLYISISSPSLTRLSIYKAATSKWTASTLITTT